MKKRQDILTEDKWRLEDMLPDDSTWESLFEETKKKIKGYGDFRGHLGESGRNLYECLSFDEKCSLNIEVLYVYARMRSDEDTAVQKYQAMSGRAQSLSYEAAELSSYIIPEILSIPEERLAGFFKSEPALEEYKRELELIMRKREHTLSEEMEELLAQSYDATQGASRIFHMFNNADIRFPEIEGEDGEMVRISHGNFISLMESGNREVRKRAFEGLYGVYKQFSNTVAAAFESNVKQAGFYGKIRKYRSGREYYLFENEIPEKVYDNLIHTVREHLPLLHKYVSVRKQVLGVPELHMYDLYTPMVKDIDKKYTFEEAKKMVLEALKPLGEEYLSVLREGFENRWIDVYENEGKRSGAYSWGAYGSHPYVLLNFQGNLNSVFTLAHEMGHAIHTYYSEKYQPYTYAGYKIFVAEVASTCNEILLIRHLLQKTSDKKEKCYLLNHFLESFRGTVFRQTMFAEFEAEVHRMSEAGETLTSQTLSGLYRKLNEDYFGPEMVVDHEIDYEWERIPHFYTPFYVYQYATGFSAAAAISSRILNGEEGALEGYKEFLKSGSKDAPLELLKLAGVHMETEKPIKDALSLFGELLEEFQNEYL